MAAVSRPLLFIGSLSLVLALCGCRKSPPSPMATPLPVPAKTENGWPLYEKPDEGFALALPPAWKQFDMNKQAFEGALKDKTQKDQGMANVLKGLEGQIAKGMCFFGIDVSTVSSGMATNANVLKLPVGAMAFDSIVDGNVKALESLPSVTKPLKRTRTKTQAGEAERLEYVMSTPGPGGRPIKVALNQYLFVHENHGYFLTMTTKENTAEKYQSTFDQIAKSFRFIEKK